MNAPRFDRIELDALRQSVPIARLFTDAGCKVVRGKCACPFHNDKTPSLSIRERTNSFLCFGCGASGDPIDAVMLFKGCDFPTAVDFLGGTRALEPAERLNVERRAAEIAAEEEADRTKERGKARRMFGGGLPLAGTHAARYLEARCVSVNSRMSTDLRFAPALPYYAGSNEIGRFPALLAAIRDVEGALIACQRIYLDPEKPFKLGDVEKGAAPAPEGFSSAKKITGTAGGGVIWLSPVNEGTSAIIGEGIDSALSGFQLAGDINAPEDAAVIAAVSMGNLSGRAMARIPHPRKPAPATIPNGHPDPDRPGMILPPNIKTVFLLVDGDSDPFSTPAHILTAGARFADQGCEVFICPAPPGEDHNDFLQRVMKGGE